MTIIKWRDGYNTGVAQFDKEHHKLVELIDVMYRAIRDKKGKEVTENVIGELINYTVYHFNNEERAMAVVNFPELEEHKAEHAKLKQEAQDLQVKIMTGFPDGAVELYHFLRDWLINHIQDSDKKYGPYLKDTKDTVWSTSVRQEET